MTPVSEIIQQKGGMALCVEHNDPVIDAISLMAELNIGAVLVKRQGAIAGIFTERDYLQKIALRDRSSRDTPVRDVMSSPVISAGPEDSVSHCMEVMTDCRCRHLPIVKGDELLGIVSIGDLVKAKLDEQRAQIDQLNQYIAGSY
jgi:CBS domain-containing protein